MKRATNNKFDFLVIISSINFVLVFFFFLSFFFDPNGVQIVTRFCFSFDGLLLKMYLFEQCTVKRHEYPSGSYSFSITNWWFVKNRSTNGSFSRSKFFTFWAFMSLKYFNLKYSDSCLKKKKRTRYVVECECFFFF